ncbi:hypothetical protein [Nocardia sp. NPDC048505]|uniref:hypothetical protein n=1 Tax=unclassified Nocardia TaxID=2637762 RepID=UPI0033F3B553
MIRRPTTPTPALVEVVVVRDPDGPNVAVVLVDGIRCPAVQFDIDAGAGWTWSDWKDARDVNLNAASPAARDALLDLYRLPPGGRYLWDRGDAGWLDGVL